MTQLFTNKVALVTGGGTGIGRAIAERYAREGAEVLIVGRRESVLKEVAEQTANISYQVADLTKTEDVTAIVERLNKDFNGQLDILVNNAGWCPVQPLKEITLADYDTAFNLDVRSLLDVTIQTLPLILKSKGNIINISTVGASHRAPNLSMYIGAKSAVESFTRIWAMELAADGVRVNAIAPGAIRTDIWNVTNLSEEEERRHEQNITSTIPMGRFGSPEEVANVAAFLGSDQASYVSGSIYGVDGAQGAS